MQVGKLNVYRNSDPEELSTLHLSDRLMVQLIKIDRLGPRLEGMLYKAKFEESFGLVDDVSPATLCAQFVAHSPYAVIQKACRRRQGPSKCHCLQGIAQCEYLVLCDFPF
jgi:hypothetical protein